MRIIEKFKSSSLSEIVEHLNHIRMGTIVSVLNEVFTGTPLPWVVRELENDRIELLGHFAASNPHLRCIREEPAVMITFLGPNAYVSPRGLPTPRSAPTWNYTAIHVSGKARLLEPEGTEHAVETLIGAVEHGRSEPWRSAEMEMRREQLMRHIVGLRIVSSSMEAKFKLGQNESPADLSAIFQQLSAAGHTRLVAMMRNANASRVLRPNLDDDRQ